MILATTEHPELVLMFSDIVGYSRVMGQDETLAIEMLNEYRKILLRYIEEYGGIFIEFAGDAIFSRFNSSQAAVSAAIAIQRHLLLYNQSHENTSPLLQIRIGIHKGEVVLRGSAIYGDSVNIAARLESISVADGICISKAVYDDVRSSISVPIKSLGVQNLKNIDHKIVVYLLKPQGIDWADHIYYLFRAWGKNLTRYRFVLILASFILIAASVYLIPRWLVPGYNANYVEIANFQNLMNIGGDGDYLSLGITEAVRSQLADIHDVYLVQASKGIRAPIRLEGSVQKIGNQLRIVYRIIRRDKNIQIAGGKLDGAYADIFILQDRLVGEIASYLANEFKLENFRPAPLKLTKDLAAYDFYMQGLAFLNKPYSQENFDAAIKRFTDSLIHDQGFVLANSGLCEVYRLKYQQTKLALWIENAERHCLMALAQDKESANVYIAIGGLYRDTGRYTDALSYLQKAIEKDSSSVNAAIALARTYDLMQDDASAENIYKNTIKKSPKHWLAYQGYGYFLIRKGRHLEAIDNYTKVLSLTPENVSTLNNMGTAYLYLGEFKKAAAYIERASALEPRGNLFLNAGSMYYFSGNFQKAIEMYQQALRLEPDNVEFLVNIGDAYFFANGNNAIADKYFKKAQWQAEKELQSNKGGVSHYQLAALAYGHFGDLDKAKKMIAAADEFDAKNTISLYVHLRLAVLEGDDLAIRDRLSALLASNYSEKLVLADPYFSVLKQARFQDVFTH